MILIILFILAAWLLASILVTALYAYARVSIRREHAKYPKTLLVIRQLPEPEPPSDE